MSSGSNPVGVKETFEKFVAAINGHDVEALTSLMTAPSVRGFHGESSTRSRVYADRVARVFRHVSGLCDHGKRNFSESGTVLATGEAGGTIDNTTWQTPSAWQATIRDGKIAEWRVFADNKPVYEILARWAR